MNSNVESIGDLAERLQAVATDADVQFTAYPSGSAMLDVRRHGRLFVMAFSPNLGFGVDEVRDGEGLQNTYQFVFSDFQPAANKLWELAAGPRPPHDADRNPDVQLSLVVIYAADMAASKAFYEALGLTFVREKHGGPEHFAARLGGAVFEIYPRKQSGTQAAPVRLGFRVASVDKIVEVALDKGAPLVTAAHDSAWGRRAVVKDPDGNTVEISANATAG